MSQEDKVLKYLSQINPNFICDDCLAKSLNFSQRQTSNMITRKLLADERILKPKRRCYRCGKNKLSSSYNTKKSTIENNCAHINHLDDLLSIGFSKVGEWELVNEQLRPRIEKLKLAKPTLYAFTLKRKIMYVGKTRRRLYKRMNDYSRGYEGQKTSHRIHMILKEMISNNHNIEIYGLHNEMPLNFGKFKINLPAGLEDNIISTIKPIWNIH